MVAGLGGLAAVIIQTTIDKIGGRPVSRMAVIVTIIKSGSKIGDGSQAAIKGRVVLIGGEAIITSLSRTT